MSLFVDTSAWYAAADRGDRNNSRAKRVLGSVQPLVTTDHVLIETWILLRHRLGRDSAGRFWDGLRTGVCHIESTTSADLEAARAISESYSDNDFSIVDCTSFAVMQRLGVHQVATFDSDFAVFRFGPGRRRAFTIVR
ncbi:MAG TPA: PIN domain-containing protein [Polyangiaceae bacterium]|jgi:predicted nucleic acid-binding protein